MEFSAETRLHLPDRLGWFKFRRREQLLNAWKARPACPLDIQIAFQKLDSAFRKRGLARVGSLVLQALHDFLRPAQPIKGMPRASRWFNKPSGVKGILLAAEGWPPEAGRA